jgi:hypothetical protein
VAQTAILFVAMWIMIKVQNLNNHIPGLIGSAAIATALDMVLDHFVGINLITVPIVCVVLCFCIAKVTVTTNVFDTDVIFTVAVGYAVDFVLNLFVIGALMGDLHPSDVQTEHLRQQMDEMGESYADDKEAPVQTTNTASGKLITLGKAPVRAAKTNLTKAASTNSAQGKAANAAKKKNTYSRIPEPQGPGAQAAKGFILKGITKAANISTAMIYTGVKTYNITAGESLFMDTPKGKVNVQCEAVEEEQVVLSISGLKVTLFLP